MYQNRQLGQLNILKNDKKHRYKAQVVFVRVKTNLKGTGTGKTGNLTGEEAFLEKYLKQALVKLELPKDSKGNPKDIVFDLTEIDPKTKKLLYPDFNKDYTLLHTPKFSKRAIKVLNKYNKTKGGDKLVEFMEKKFNKKHPIYKDHYKVFIFGDRGGKNINKKYTGLGGYAKAINSKAVAAFDGRTDATITHETLHAIGLHHTFSTDKKNPFSYKKGATYNIMDYSHLNKYGSKGRILTWLWQWNFLWSKLPKE